VKIVGVEIVFKKVKIVTNNVRFNARGKVMVTIKQVYAINNRNLNPYTFGPEF
jgi:hypothetical protein